mgnify:CR=1 FL=1
MVLPALLISCWMPAPALTCHLADTCAHMCDIDVIFTSGQAFTWRRLESSAGSSWVGVLGSRLILLKQEQRSTATRRATARTKATLGVVPGHLVCDGCASSKDAVFTLTATLLDSSDDSDIALSTSRFRDFLTQYLRLDTNLQVLWQEWTSPTGHAVVDGMRTYLRDVTAMGDRRDLPPFGLRLLRQDPLTMIVSFICSQNNHQSRIAAMVMKVCSLGSGARVYDGPLASSMLTGKITLDVDGVGVGGKRSRDPQVRATFVWYPFPTAVNLSKISEERWRAAGFGYRAKYMAASSLRLARDDAFARHLLHSPADVPLGSLREALTSLSGVGRKVADCIALMAYGGVASSIVPIDTHMAQVTVDMIRRAHAPKGPPAKAGSAASHRLLAELMDVEVPVVRCLLEVKKRDTKLAVTPRLHDCFQRLYVSVFGNYAGWAHCFLFSRRVSHSAVRLTAAH